MKRVQVHCWQSPPQRPLDSSHVSSPAKILCIAGTSQNGATLLCRTLGGLPGFVPVGEIGRLWDKGILEDRACACGERFLACPFWTKVGESAFGGWDQVDGRHVAELRRVPGPGRRTLPYRFALLFMVRPEFSPRYRRNLDEYGRFMRRLYEGVADVAGSRVIVDSTKLPPHVHAIANLPGADASLLHLVRDSRGVAYSGLKWVRRQSGEKPYRLRRSPWKTAVVWDATNVGIDLLRRRGKPVVLVRYEDFVRVPADQVRLILRKTEMTVADEALAFIRGQEVDLPPDHLVAGNRVRFTEGPMVLHSDEAWRTGLSVGQRRVVEAITGPLLRRYGYNARS